MKTKVVVKRREDENSTKGGWYAVLDMPYSMCPISANTLKEEVEDIASYTTSDDGSTMKIQTRFLRGATRDEILSSIWEIVCSIEKVMQRRAEYWKLFTDGEEIDF